MKIVIAGPPKTGNVWLKCLLGNIYSLRPLGPKHVPKPPRYDTFVEWATAGGFKDGTIFHQHFGYSPELADAFDAAGAQTVTIIRDPYDTFVSSYFTVQNHADDQQRKGRRTDLLVGKPLDHPDVLTYLLGGGFRSNMARAKEWLESGRSVVVRYEDLHRDPISTLERLATQLAPVDRAEIERAVETCSADNMRKMSAGKSQHVRAATVGDSKQHLNAGHLAIFRERYADLIQSLGYEVR